MRIRKRQHTKIVCLMIIFFLTMIKSAVFAESDNLGMLSLDELLNVDIVSVAKLPEKIIKTPAAVHVITGEDLRRSGVTSIPEALRMVPGMDVYRIDANKWAISARGFANKFSNKMLVMIDGRTVYTPLFSGVYWDVQDTMLEDIDRIEVICGPGGSLWGSNAVNGIINIITKDSADTQGGLVTFEGGSKDKGTEAARYGGWLDERTSYRVYCKYFDRDGFDTIKGDSASNSYHSARTGFRMDRNLDGGDKITLQGDLYKGISNSDRMYITLKSPYSYWQKSSDRISGGNISGKWSHIISDNSDMVLKFYYDHTKREEIYSSVTRNTIDMDFQHRFHLTNNNEILWGLEYCYNQDDIPTYTNPATGLYAYKFDPQTSSEGIFSGFIQNRSDFDNKKGEITIGTKFEHNNYTGLEWQPSARFIWRFNNKNSIWSAISRSVRIPSRIENDGTINTTPFFKPILPPTGITMMPRITANDKLKSEKVMSYELGFRKRASDNIFMDISLFYNHYKDIIAGVKTGKPFLETYPSIHMVVPITMGNNFTVDSFGSELSCNWAIRKWWRLTSGFTWFKLNIVNDNGTTDPRPDMAENNNSEYQASLISYMDLPHNLELNTMLFYVDGLDYSKVDSYVRCDINMSWHSGHGLAITIGGRNLFNGRHIEFNSEYIGIAETYIPTTFYGKITWSF